MTNARATLVGYYPRGKLLQSHTRLDPGVCLFDGRRRCRTTRYRGSGILPPHVLNFVTITYQTSQHGYEKHLLEHAVWRVTRFDRGITGTSLLFSLCGKEKKTYTNGQSIVSY